MEAPNKKWWVVSISVHPLQPVLNLIHIDPNIVLELDDSRIFKLGSKSGSSEQEVVGSVNIGSPTAACPKLDPRIDRLCVSLAVEEPCQPGCTDLAFCTNFNHRPMTLFRNCNPEADSELATASTLHRSRSVSIFYCLDINKYYFRFDRRTPIDWKKIESI